MRPRKTKNAGEQDLFRSRLDQIINITHPLARLAGLVDWDRLHDHFAPYYSSKGRAGLPIRLMVGLHLLKHIYALSDEEVCARWEENPYFQLFCGETFFQHRFPLERSSLTHFRGRIDPSALESVLQESLVIACGLGALKLKDLKKVAVDTTVQEKNVAYPTDHGLLQKAILKLGAAARSAGIKLRQSYTRIYLSKQKRGVTADIKRDIKRRSVIEPIIGHIKNDGLMARNYLKGRKGDHLNAILASIGFNFRQILSAMAA